MLPSAEYPSSRRSARVGSGRWCTWRSSCGSVAGWCSGWQVLHWLAHGVLPSIPPMIWSARVVRDSPNTVRARLRAPVRCAPLGTEVCQLRWTRLAGGEPNIRSGSPNNQGECRLKYPASGPIRSVQLEYRYASGYGCGPPPEHTCDNPPTMELWAQTDTGANAGGPIYNNPKMDLKSGCV